MIHGQLCCLECSSYDSIPLVTGPIIDEEHEVLHMPIGLQDVTESIGGGLYRLRCGHSVALS
jgi:hypothetical protein